MSAKRPSIGREKKPLLRAASEEYPSFAKEVKQSAGRYTKYAKNLYQTVGYLGINNERRPRSAKAIDIRGLKYKFKVVDI